MITTTMMTTIRLESMTMMTAMVIYLNLYFTIKDGDDDDNNGPIKNYDDDDDDKRPICCYRDRRNNHNLDQKVNTDGFLTVNKCIDKCEDENYKLAGVAKSGGECWCGSRNNNRKTYDSSDCKFIKDRGGYAGGDTVISVY
mmetsp:Transcript_9952/g.11353  ORF Transcript_9952/g.11353 Transcript_9952/m.11353 type:complete len:141 (-) Transcript_9952:15-437(-)